jgi:putative membrane-bound dehydrogenase-like protein
MKLKSILCLALSVVLSVSLQAAQPLRVFIRGGVKTHGPGQHDHPRFLGEWTKLLTERGAKVDGAMDFPTAAQLEKTDVLVMFAAEAGTIPPEQRAYLDKFLQRGGGMVCIHDAVCGKDAQWFKTIIGGAWEHGHSKWYEGELSFFYMDTEHPITKGVSNFELDDELYYELHMMPEARILAATYTPKRPNNNPRAGSGNKPSVYDIQPQMWTYEKDNRRSFVSLLGHNYKTFGLPHVRAVMLRGIAWAGKRANVDEFCNKDELASLRYPEGGPTAPEKAAAKLELHPDFTIQLVAAEPLINKPMNIDWDPAGRLWVAETPEYPNGRREPKSEMKDTPWKDSGFRVRPPTKERPAIDRISILTDTDSDGRMDKKEIFYEGLELVTSFVFYKDGVIVSQAPDILRLRDVNSDGKAEKVETLYTGLGIGDTHAVINNLRWGMDGWIYATHGYSSSAHVYNGDKSKDFGNIGSGVVRFKPDGSMIEQASSKGGNTWGMEIASDGELFYTQPTSGDLLNHIVMTEGELSRGKVGNATSYKPVIRGQKSFPLITYNQQAYVQIDLVGYFTAAAGCAIYGGGAWPGEWNYNYFTTEPTINIIHHQVVEPNGVTFKAHKTREAEFIGGRDKWFRPIDTRIGPDGALYITDFYNQAVVHNDTRGTIHGPANAALRPDRDHYFGRIWRVNHKQAKKLKVPNIAKASTKDLVEALQNPNRHVRMNAQRMLVEKNDPKTPDATKRLLSSWSFRGLEEAQMHALWALHLVGRLDNAVLQQALAVDGKPAVQKAALRIAAETPAASRSAVTAGVLRRVNDSNPRVRLVAIESLASLPSTPEIRQTLVEAYPDLNDQWLESAVVGVAAKAPVEFIEAAAASRKPAELENLVVQLSSQVASKQDAALASRLVVSLASKPSNADVLKKAALENLAKTLKADTTPGWTSELQKGLQALLGSPNPALPAAALPLVARWDKDGKLASETKTHVASLTGKLKDDTQSDDTRAQVAASLVGVRQMNADILPSVAALLGSSASTSLQKRVIESLGATGDPAIAPLLAEAYGKLPQELQDAAFAQIIKRADSSLALVEALKAGKVTLATLGPSSVHRLRTHSDKAVAKRAGEVIDELRGPEVKEKNALLTKLIPEVEKPGGNAENGKKLFAANCIVCHRFNGEGKEVGPELTGMGAHGPAELLTAIIDPNREVDPSYLAWSFETKDDEIYDGVIISENRTSVTLRNNSGETSVKTADIKGRRNTGRSLMPDGFETLGAEALRDMLAYVCGSDSKYRIIDLRSAFTANSTEGIYNSRESKNESLQFRKFGLIKSGEVPFEIIHPAKSTSGNNVVVLKGGNGLAKTFPQKVETGTLNVKASRLHFLGGVGGWAYPCCGENKRENLPVAKVTVKFAEGDSEEFVLKNGVEFADYNGPHNVPGSKAVDDVVRNGQVRSFTRSLKNQSPIQKITIESFDNAVAPTFVAITADTTAGTPGDTADASAQAATRNDGSTAAAAAKPDFKWGFGIKTLMVGGGSSHDFDKWFNKADSAILSEGGLASVNYTDKPDTIAEVLKEVDVLYQSTNQKIDNKDVRKGIFDFADAGKGIVIVHAGMWYNWPDWTEYNRVLAGGGAKGHDRYGEFEVNLDVTDHPVMKGVPASFKITDELYYAKFEENGTPVQVLATAKNLTNGKTFPSVWIVKHSKARIVCIALGHDGKAHDLPAYKTMLRNAVAWAAGK